MTAVGRGEATITSETPASLAVQTVISTEEGKTLAEGVFEVSRARETMELSAEEAKRIGGEVLPLDALPATLSS